MEARPSLPRGGLAGPFVEGHLNSETPMPDDVTNRHSQAIPGDVSTTSGARRDELSLGVAVSAPSGGGVVTARKAGGLRDLGLDVNPRRTGVKAAAQHLAKAINIAFQTDFGENYLEAVYQAAIVRRGEVVVVHKEYFGFGDNWFGQLGMLLRLGRPVGPGA